MAVFDNLLIRVSVAHEEVGAIVEHCTWAHVHDWARSRGKALWFTHIYNTK